MAADVPARELMRPGAAQGVARIHQQSLCHGKINDNLSTYHAFDAGLFDLQVVFSSREHLPTAAKLFWGPKQQGPYVLACPELKLAASTKQLLELAADSLSGNRFLKILFTGSRSQGKGKKACAFIKFSALCQTAQEWYMRRNAFDRLS